MAIVKTNPTSAGRRFVVKVVSPELHKGAPHEPLVSKKSKSGGRNNKGRITVRHRGGGHKQRYRVVDFKRGKVGVPAVVERIEYDPNRSAHLALLKYLDGERAYIVAPKNLAVGGQVVAADDAPISPGNCLPLRNIPLGTLVHCIELRPGKGAQVARAAGAAAQLIAREGQYATLRMRSGEMRKVSAECRAVVGEVGNNEHSLRKGRCESLARAAANGTRRRHEPGGSPARGRRGPHVGGAPPGDALGRTDQGLQDPQEQAHRQDDRAPSRTQVNTRG